jgi:hypothetical protein
LSLTCQDLHQAVACLGLEVLALVGFRSEPNLAVGSCVAAGTGSRELALFEALRVHCHNHWQKLQRQAIVSHRRDLTLPVRARESFRSILL